MADEDSVQKVWSGWKRKHNADLSVEIEEAFAIYLDHSDQNFYHKVVTVEDLEKMFSKSAQLRAQS